MPLSDADKILNPPGVRQANSAGMLTVSAASTHTVVHQVTAGRRAIIRKIQAQNFGVAATRVQFGDSSTGLATGVFTQRIPDIPLTAGQDMYLGEDDLPAYEFNASNNITMEITAATTSVVLLIEVEEF